MKHGISAACTLAVIGLATADRALAQDRYEYRFDFGTVCG